MGLCALALPLVGCEPGSTIEIKNETAESLCFAPDPESDCRSVQPGETLEWIEVCHNNSTRDLLVRFTTGQEWVYNESAPCHDWEGVTITISGTSLAPSVTDTLDR